MPRLQSELTFRRSRRPLWGKPNICVTSRKVAALLGRNFVGPLNRQPLIHVQAKQSIGVLSLLIGAGGQNAVAAKGTGQRWVKLLTAPSRCHGASKSLCRAEEGERRAPRAARRPGAPPWPRGKSAASAPTSMTAVTVCRPLVDKEWLNCWCKGLG